MGVVLEDQLEHIFKYTLFRGYMVWQFLGAVQNVYIYEILSKNLTVWKNQY